MKEISIQLYDLLQGNLEGRFMPGKNNPLVTVRNLQELMPQPVLLTEVTYQELSTMISGGTLKPGGKYLITDFQTRHYLTDGQKNTQDLATVTGPIEPLVVMATSPGTVALDAYSILYPKDKIEYDWNPGNWMQNVNLCTIEAEVPAIIPGFKGVITYREDERGNAAPFDLRHCKTRLWSIAQPEWVDGPYDQGSLVQAIEWIDEEETLSIYQAKVAIVEGDVPGDVTKWKRLWNITSIKHWACNSQSMNYDLGTTFPVDAADFIDMPLLGNYPLMATNIRITKGIYANGTENLLLIPQIVHYTAEGKYTRDGSYGSGNNEIIHAAGSWAFSIGNQNTGLRFGQDNTSFSIGNCNGEILVGDWSCNFSIGNNNLFIKVGTNAMTFSVDDNIFDVDLTESEAMRLNFSKKIIRTMWGDEKVTWIDQAGVLQVRNTNEDAKTKILLDLFSNVKVISLPTMNDGMFVNDNLLNGAVAGVYPNFTIAYPNLLLVEGYSLRNPLNPTAGCVLPEVITFNWDNNGVGAEESDNVLLIAYNPWKDSFVINNKAIRSDTTKMMNVPIHWAGDTVHCYIAFEKEGLFSTSAFAGSVIVT